MTKQASSRVRRSMDMFERAKQIMPAGTQLISRRPSRFAYGITPVYADRAKGSRIWDIECPRASAPPWVERSNCSA